MTLRFPRDHSFWGEHVKRTRALLLAVLVIMSSSAAPEAVAATCQYNRQDLPVPAGSGDVTTQGSSTNNSRIAGLAVQQGYGRGLLWVNSTLRLMPAPSSDWDHVVPEAVTNTSVVAGYLRNDRGIGLRHQAFRYENGVYELLRTEPGSQSKAVAINDAGDVLGVVWSGSSESSGTVVMWPRTGDRTTVAAWGDPVGINAQRKVVINGRFSTVVLDLESGVKTELPGESRWVVFDNDRVLRGEFTPSGASQITEWDLNGVKTATYDGGVKPFGRNGSGTVFGTYDTAGNDDIPSLWRKTGRSDVVADPAPLWTVYADVTDAATLIATYVGPDGARPARWLWVCS